jgi:hypothetical protein
MDQSKKQAAAEAQRLRIVKENEARAAAEEARFDGKSDPDKGLEINPDIVALWYRTWAAWRADTLKPYFKGGQRYGAKKLSFPEFMNENAFDAYRASGLILAAGVSRTEVIKSWQPQPGVPGAFSHLLTNERLWLFDGSSHRCFALADIQAYKARLWPSLVFFYLNRMCGAMVLDRQGRTWKFRRLGNIPGRKLFTRTAQIGPFADPPEGRAARAEIKLSACGIRCPQCGTDVRVVMGRNVVLCPQCRALLEQCPICSSPKLKASKTDFEQFKSLAPGLLVGGLIGGVGGHMAVSQGIDAMSSPGGSMRRCRTCLHSWKASRYY